MERGRQRFLEDLVEKEFEVRGETDASFAEFAGETLGFHVTEGNVKGARKVFGIPGTAAAKAAGKEVMVAELREELRSLAMRVAGLETRVDGHVNLLSRSTRLLEELEGVTDIHTRAIKALEDRFHIYITGRRADKKVG